MAAAEYEITSEHFVNEEGSDFATVRIAFPDGEVIEERFARWFDSGPIESALEQAASFVASFEEAQEFSLEERLGPYGLEWEREQAERRGWL